MLIIACPFGLFILTALLFVNLRLLTTHLVSSSCNCITQKIRLCYVFIIIYIYVCIYPLRSFMTSLNIPSGKESEDLPYLYWIPKLHKTPYKEMYIAGSKTCSTKELSIHLTKILSAVKERQQKYCETAYSRSGITHMWILKNSKKIFWITLNQDLSLRYPPSKLLIFQLYIPPYRMTN